MVHDQRGVKLPPNCNLPSLARAILAEFIGTFILVVSHLNIIIVNS